MILCKYGHKHRSKSGVEWCELVTPWNEIESQIETTDWQPEGTKEEWCNVGRFRAHLWSLMRYHILKRDRVCQYESCGVLHDQRIGGFLKQRYYHVLEVHHIIPRRHGGTDHPANLISLCHDHHRIQPAHHHDSGLVIRNADIPITPFPQRKIRRARPCCETTLDMF